MKRKCEYCGKEHDRKRNSLYCSHDCTVKAAREQRHLDRINNPVEGVEGVDYLVCGWCGEKVKQITSAHLNKYHPGKTKADYKAEFNVKSTFCEKSATNFGKHMKEEKYKTLFAEKIKGEKNCNHKSNTTEFERRSRSPRCIEFYQVRYPDKTIDEQQELLNTYYDKLNETVLRPTQLQYWLNKGYSEKESKNLLSERQYTFSLESCITKYGKEEGTKIYNNRQEKWSEKIESQYRKGKFTKTTKSISSKPCKEFIDSLVLAGAFASDDYYAAKCGKSGNEFWRRFREVGQTFAYDFVHRESKVIIEFQGTIWHADPRFYDADSSIPFRNILAKEKWASDKLKKDLIESAGYKLIYVWEYDYKTNPEAEIKKCLDFIYENM